MGVQETNNNIWLTSLLNDFYTHFVADRTAPFSLGYLPQPGILTVGVAFLITLVAEEHLWSCVWGGVGRGVKAVRYGGGGVGRVCGMVGGGGGRVCLWEHKSE